MALFESGFLLQLRSYFNTHPRAEHYSSVILKPIEAVIKKPLFGCQECGQCLLHENGMVCPMRCPKNLRNGPCGGVRANGHCEVYPERWCVWYRAYNRSKNWPLPHEWREDIYRLHPAVNWELINTSSIVNLITGRDQGVMPKKPDEKKKAPAPKIPAKT